MKFFLTQIKSFTFPFPLVKKGKLFLFPPSKKDEKSAICQELLSFFLLPLLSCEELLWLTTTANPRKEGEIGAKIEKKKPFVSRGGGSIKHKWVGGHIFSGQFVIHFSTLFSSLHGKKRRGKKAFLNIFTLWKMKRRELRLRAASPLLSFVLEIPLFLLYYPACNTLKPFLPFSLY